MAGAGRNARSRLEKTAARTANQH